MLFFFVAQALFATLIDALHVALLPWCYDDIDRGVSGLRRSGDHEGKGGINARKGEWNGDDGDGDGEIAGNKAMSCNVYIS